MIYEILKKGQENALSTEELCYKAGIENVWSLRRQIKSERDAGRVIASKSSGGYYIPVRINEVKEYLSRLEGQSLSTIRSLKSAKKLLREAQKRGEDFDFDEYYCQTSLYDAIE